VQQLPGFGLEFDRARAADVASDLVLDVIHRYEMPGKPFGLNRFYLMCSGNKQFPFWRMNAGMCSCLAPSLKARERGFNQAERLARRLSIATRIPMNARLVRRVEFTPNHVNPIEHT
jgi:hypothetical protein